MRDQAPQDNKIRQVMDACLPGLENRPDFDRAVLRRAKGEERVKKKISAGFVLAVVLALAVVTALAAMTLNAYYERTIEKEGQSGRIETWRAEDKVTLVDWMVEAGIELDAEQVARLHDESLSEEQRGALAMEVITGYYPARDGVLTSVDIIAREKGPIEFWTLEDRAWLSELLAKYQPEEVALGRNLLPAEADITQQAAQDIFFAHYLDTYGLEQDAFDLSTFTVSFGENTFDDGSGPRKVRHWTFNVDLKETGGSVGAYIGADGTIINAVDPFASDWRDDWYDTSMADEFWTIEGMCRFQEEWEPRVAEILAAGETPYDDLVHLLTKRYALPKETDVSEERATELATAAAMAHGDLTQEDLSYYLIRKAYTLDDADNGRYFFWYLTTRRVRELPEEERARLIPIAVHIDAATGEVLEVKTTAGHGIEEIF